MSNSYNFSHRKLTDAQADEIRKKYNPVTKTQLAKEYGVSETCIRRILSGKLYRQPNPLKK